MKIKNKFNLIVFFFVFFCCINFLYAQSPIPSGAKLEQIATGIHQPEGPVWKDGVGLLFSDVQAAIIYQWSPADNSLTKYLAKSDSSNGLTFDKQGRLILTQMGKRRVSRQELNGTITPLAEKYLGGRFNSPNDVVVKSDGSIFFTDPDFNVPNNAPREIIINNKTIKGIYRISSKTGQVQLLDDTFTLPNGICFSPDEKKLYVNESQKVQIYSFDVINDSTIANKTLLYTLPQAGYADGMKVDSVGNIYCAGPTGIWIIPPSGNNYLAKISMPNNASASNCAWGDADKKTLYITSGSSVYKIRLAPTTKIEDRHGSIIPNNFNLFQNYPNPFNPSTLISYQIPFSSYVSLKVFNDLGREIKTLVSEYQNAGLYQSQFSILNSQFSSGVYFYTLVVSNFSQTKKMMLIK